MKLLAFQLLLLLQRHLPMKLLAFQLLLLQKLHLLLRRLQPLFLLPL
jgi:hypothetical protein